MNLKFEEINSTKDKLNEEMSLLKINLENRDHLNENLNNKLEKLSNEKFELHVEIETLKEREVELMTENEKLKIVISKMDLEFSNYNTSISQLSAQNEQLNESMSDSIQEKNNLSRILMAVKEEQIAITRENEKLNEMFKKVSDENEELVIERDDCNKMKLSAIKKHDTQMKALNQNLANLRAQLKVQNDKVVTLQQEFNQVKGNNLELEAKFSNCTDERNLLLERCVNSEKMFEVFKNQSIDLKRKLEDTQSALQELGREHQSLQVVFFI